MSANMTVDQVCAWLQGLGLSKDYSDVMRENAIDGDALTCLSDKDLKDEMGIAALGDRRKITTALEKFKAGGAPSPPIMSAPSPPLGGFSHFGGPPSNGNAFLYGGGLGSDIFGGPLIDASTSNLFSGVASQSNGFVTQDAVELLTSSLSSTNSPIITPSMPPLAQRLAFPPTTTTPVVAKRAPSPPTPVEESVSGSGVGSSWADMARRTAVPKEDAPAMQQVIAPAEHKDKDKESHKLHHSSSADAWNNSNPDPEKLKTKMCKRWEDTGNCHFGNACWFAHGDVELKPGEVTPTGSKTTNTSPPNLKATTAAAAAAPSTASNSSYRTRLCHHFKSGNCPRGDKCDFAHGESQLQRLNNSELCIFHFSVGCHTPNCQRSHDEKYRSSVVKMHDKTPSGQSDMPYQLLSQYQAWYTPKGMWLIESRLREGERRNRSTGPHLGAITVLAGDDSPVRGFKVRLDKDKQKYQWDRE